jgi:hypothetical protein
MVPLRFQTHAGHRLARPRAFEAGRRSSRGAASAADEGPASRSLRALRAAAAARRSPVPPARSAASAPAQRALVARAADGPPRGRVAAAVRRQSPRTRRHRTGCACLLLLFPFVPVGDMHESPAREEDAQPEEDHGHRRRPRKRLQDRALSSWRTARRISAATTRASAATSPPRPEGMSSCRRDEPDKAGCDPRSSRSEAG